MAPPVSRVVVGFDGSSSGQAALETAIAEAAARRVPLSVLSVVDPPSRQSAALPSLHRTTREAARQAARRAAVALGEVSVHWQIDVGQPAAALIGHCHSDDLLVVGCRGHRPVARVLLGSTSGTVAAHAPCPVLVVRGLRTRRHGPVVVGSDGSSASAVAVAFAADMAEREGTGLSAVLALPPVTDAMGFVSGWDEGQITAARVELSRSLAGVAADHPGIIVSEDLIQAHPVDALLRHARDARAVVVGSRGAGGVPALVLGSVSRGLLLHSPAPVAVVRPMTPESGESWRHAVHA